MNLNLVPPPPFTCSWRHAVGSCLQNVTFKIPLLSGTTVQFLPNSASSPPPKKQNFEVKVLVSVMTLTTLWGQLPWLCFSGPSLEICEI